MDNMYSKKYDYLKKIETLEREYLEQIYYILTIDKDKLINALNSKNDIKDDWFEVPKLKNSDIAIGSERIFYWLFNQFGKPNSSPIGSDLFFETYNAFIHIDIKTVNFKSNKGDFVKRLNIGKNQTSYNGIITYENGGFKEYYCSHLPTHYNKNKIDEKICLSYFIGILTSKLRGDIQTIILTCVPNGELANFYDNGIKISEDNDKVSLLAPGKNDTEARFRYEEYKYFDLISDDEEKFFRTKVLYFKKNMDEEIFNKIEYLKTFKE